VGFLVTFRRRHTRPDLLIKYSYRHSLLSHSQGGVREKTRRAIVFQDAQAGQCLPLAKLNEVVSCTANSTTP